MPSSIAIVFWHFWETNFEGPALSKTKKPQGEIRINYEGGPDGTVAAAKSEREYDKHDNVIRIKNTIKKPRIGYRVSDILIEFGISVIIINIIAFLLLLYPLYSGGLERNRLRKREGK